MREEIFGPVVTIHPFDTEDEAIELANDSPYGLACCVWTESGRRGRRCAERIKAGYVWVNCWMVRDLTMPFGGVKQSGTWFISFFISSFYYYHDNFSLDYTSLSLSLSHCRKFFVSVSVPVPVLTHTSQDSVAKAVSLAGNSLRTQRLFA